MYLYKLDKYTIVKQGIVSSYVVAAENENNAKELCKGKNFNKYQDYFLWILLGTSFDKEEKIYLEKEYQKIERN